MILLTTGTQLPFDRMVCAVDKWAENKVDIEVFGQIGMAEYKPKNFSHCGFLNPEEYSKELSRAKVLVAHAGMGSIITAIEKEIPVIIMPRLFLLGEHRNDHQLSTAKRFSESQGIYVAWDENDLISLLNKRDDLISVGDEACQSRDELVAFVSDFLTS